MKQFVAYELALEVARGLRTSMTRIERRDRDLVRQTRRAVASVVLNLAEGNRRRGQDRLHMFRTAAGSAAEVRAALQLAEAWGYVAEEGIAPALELLDRLLAVLWRLTERSNPPSKAPSRAASTRASST